MKDGEQNWTPVVRKRKKKSKTMHTKESTSTSSSDSELDIGTARQMSTLTGLDYIGWWTGTKLHF